MLKKRGKAHDYWFDKDFTSIGREKKYVGYEKLLDYWNLYFLKENVMETPEIWQSASKREKGFVKIRSYGSLTIHQGFITSDLDN